MQIDTNALSVLKAFGEFARTSGANSKAVAQLFGGEDRIPQDVKEKMLLSDYGKGRPLTARRIAKVQDAIARALDGADTVEANGVQLDRQDVLGAMGMGIHADSELAKSVKPFVSTPSGVATAKQQNEETLSLITKQDFEKLPAEVKAGMDDVIAAVNERAGEGFVANRTVLCDLIRAGAVQKALSTIANGLERPFNRADVKNALLGIQARRPFVELAVLKTFISELVPNSKDRPLADALAKNVPGLVDALKGCKDKDEFKAVLDTFKPQIEQRIRLDALVKTHQNAAGDTLLGEFAEQTGIDREKLRASIPLNTYTETARNLATKILSGEVKAETDEEVSGAFRDLARQHVKARLDIAAELDTLPEISDKVKQSLRMDVLRAPSIERVKIAEYAPLAKKLGLGPLKILAAKKPPSVKDLAQALVNLSNPMFKAGAEKIGAMKWINLGADGQQPVVNIAFKCALSREPELLATLTANVAELEDAVSDLVRNGDESTMCTAFIGALKTLAAD